MSAYALRAQEGWKTKLKSEITEIIPPESYTPMLRYSGRKILASLKTSYKLLH